MHRLSLATNRLGVDENSAICEFAGCEDPIPLLALHPSKNNSIQASDWVLHMAKEIQHFVGILYDGFVDQFIA